MVVGAVVVGLVVVGASVVGTRVVVVVGAKVIVVVGGEVVVVVVVGGVFGVVDALVGTGVVENARIEFKYSLPALHQLPIVS